MTIRELDPGSAWNEAERFAIPFGIVGFFVAGVTCAFGHYPGIKEPFLAGICGAGGLFLAEMVFAIAYYHKKLALAVIAMLATAILPTIITSMLLPLTGNGKAAFIPMIGVGICLYAILHRLHQTASGLTLSTYARQLAYDQHGTPKAAWESKVIWLLAGLGIITIIELLTRR